jgi:hypothetical protein
MNVKHVARALIAAALIATGWCLARVPLTPTAEAQGGEKAVKGSRYQVVSAGLISAVMIDTETGKTWALTSGGNGRDRPGFGDAGGEFAWAPIARFDDLESYRRWVKQQAESRSSTVTRVRGIVTYKGAPMKNAIIKFHSNPARDAFTNADGTYEMPRAPAGRWRVTLFVPDNADARKSIEPQEAINNKAIQDPKTTNIEVEIRQGVVNNIDINFR